jgi:2-polyprenyl-3-methyl-5-hydroxy-6-metoxy-1,4-benzoquinol methylase
MATYLITRFNHFDCYLDNHSTKLSTIKYNTKMKATGERMIPKIEDGTYFEHLHRYAFADEFVNNKIVLDIASGEGYGSFLLAKNADFVYGVDISEEAITYAKKNYRKDNLEFRVGNTSKIPLDSNSVDIVVSFETIEHHDQHDEMMKEIKRVLKKDGKLIISSPNKKYYSDENNTTNHFHIKELHEDEFKMLLNNYFRSTKFLNQNLLISSVLVPQNESQLFFEYSGNHNNHIKTNDLSQFWYSIAVASDNDDIPILPVSIFKTSLPAQNILYNQSLIDVYKNSLSYKLGYFLLHPTKFIKNIFTNRH